MDWKILLEPHVLAVVISLLATWGATEFVKRAVRSHLDRKPYDGRYDLVPPLLGFAIGTVIGTFSWPKDTEVEPIVFGITIGISAPMIYGAVVKLIRWRWPELANKITGSKP